MKKSFLDCPHNNVQAFSEFCLDCGYNVYTANKDYLRDLQRQTGEPENNKAIRALEKKLGIG